jgi:TonB family protein
MKKILFSVFLFFLIKIVIAQEYCEEIPPLYPGGKNAISKLFEDSVKLPKNSDCITGKVIVQFVVDKSGKVCDIRIAQSLRADLDKEAIRLIGLLKKWKPGLHNNIKIKSFQRQPITFIIDDDCNEKMDFFSLLFSEVIAIIKKLLTILTDILHPLISILR